MKRQKSIEPPRFTISLLVILLGLASACSGQETAETAGPLPAAIGGLELVQMTSGPEAVAMTERLHGKAVAPSETYIGRYGDGSTHAMLYVSRFGSGQEAESVLADMSTSMGEGSSGFGHHKQFASGGSEIHVVLGQGQVNFFFVRAADLYWLGMAAETARAGLAQLLDMAPEELPILDSLLSAPDSLLSAP